MKLYLLLLFVIIPTTLATYCVENKFQGAYNVSEPCFMNNTHICLEDKYLYEDRFCSLYFIGYETVVDKVSGSCRANVHTKLNNLSQDVTFPIVKNIIDKRPIFVNETIYVNNTCQTYNCTYVECKNETIYVTTYIPGKPYRDTAYYLMFIVATLGWTVIIWKWYESRKCRNNPKK